MSQMKIAEFEFEAEGRSLAHFLRDKCEHLPVLVRVENGFCSPENAFEFSGEEIYLVTHVKTHPRIIGRSECGLNFSLPTDHQMKFYICEEGRTKRGPCNLVDIVNFAKHNYDRPWKLEPEKVEQVRVWQDPETEELIQLPTMQLVDSYDEKYLVASPVLGRELHDFACIVPVFLPITLCSATRLRSDGSNSAFEEEMDRIKEFASTFCNASAKGNSEILVLTQDQVDEYEGVYEQINPYALKQKIQRVPRPVYEELNDSPSELEKPRAPPRRMGKFTSAPSRIPTPPPDSDQQNLNEKIKPPETRGRIEPKDPPVDRSRSQNKYSPCPTMRKHQGHQKLHNEESAIREPARDYDGNDTENTPDPSKEFTGSTQGTDETPDEGIYALLKDVPKDIDFKSVSKKQLGEYLRMLHLDKYVAAFAEQDVDGALVLELSKECLQEDFGMSGLEATKLTKFIKDGWRSS